MSAESVERHPVDLLAEEFVERLRRGERPAISEYTRRFPDLADKLQEILAALVLIEEHGRAQRSPDFAAGELDAPRAAAPIQLGEYRVLREIGRGGMGVVYEAVQESLGRHVALKVLPSHALLDEVHAKRFQHEAQAAARLHHTNIVPIFGVGAADGVCYYAMQFIEGRGLDEVLAELRQFKREERPGGSAARPADAGKATAGQRVSLSTISDTPRYFRRVAALGAQVADALDHAHRHGVLHRDIKPSNLLLDAQGTVWITDFGLAKAEGLEELTQSGDLVGTLRYMAPEQMRGKSDARADIYSLGSTLYELLTLRPAFDAADRAALMRQIADDEPPRPRRVDARIPRDLETIVLKAMSHEAALRYATAGAMAADLRRYVDDKPIAARPVGATERLWRWCLRRPALAGLCAALAMSLLIGVLGVFWEWSRAERNLREAVRQQGIAVDSLQKAQRSQQRSEQNAAEAERQRSIAELRASEADANYQTARKAVHELLTMVSEDELVMQPGMQPLRVQLLTRALQFYEQRLAARDSDPTARRDLALAYLRLGLIRQQMGPTGNEAGDDYRRAMALLMPDKDRAGASGRATRMLLCKIENNLGLELLKQNKLAAAHDELEKARQRLAQQLAATPDDFETQTVQAMTLNNLGYHVSLLPHLPHDERHVQAIGMHEEALGIYRRLAERQPQNLSVLHSLANTLSNLGRRHQELHHDDTARQCMEECARLREELVKLQPASLEFQASRAASLNALGDVIRASQLAADQRLSQALPYYEQSLALQERLVRENPEVLRFVEELGNLHVNISDLYEGVADLQQALRWRRREVEVWDRCLTQEAPHAEAQRLRASALHKQGEFEHRLELYPAAAQSWQKAREAWQALEASPTTWEVSRGKVVLNLRQLMLELAQQDRVGEIWAVADERRRLAGESTEERLSQSYDLERSFRALGRGGALLGADLAKQKTRLAQAISIFREVAAAEPAVAEKFARARKSMGPYVALIKLDADLKRQPDSAVRLIRRARLLRELGGEAQAEEDDARALELLARPSADSASEVIARRQRAQLQFDAGRWAQAFEESGHGLELQPNDYLLLRLHGLAGIELERWQEAGRAFESILENRPELVHYWPWRLRGLTELDQPAAARAAAARLPALAKSAGKNADFVVWYFFESGQARYFQDAALQLATAAYERHPTNTYRCELGGVQFYRGEYREAIQNLIGAAAEDRTTPSAVAGFWLALCHHHLGEPDLAQRAFRRAVRNWKGLAALPADEERLLDSLWRAAGLAVGEPKSLAQR